MTPQAQRKHFSSRVEDLPVLGSKASWKLFLKDNDGKTRYNEDYSPEKVR